MRAIAIAITLVVSLSFATTTFANCGKDHGKADQTTGSVEKKEHKGKGKKGKKGKKGDASTTASATAEDSAKKE